LARDLDGRRDVEVIGPAEARGRRLRLLVRLSRRQSLGKVLDRTLLRQAHLDVRIDVDPYDTF
jgi:primosomal protein N'